MRGLFSTRDIRTANTPLGLLGLRPRPPMADEGDEMFLRRYAAQGYEGQPAGVLGKPQAVAMPQAQPVGPQRPERRGVSPWRILDRVLGGQTISEGLDAERERIASEPLREASRERMMRLQSYIDTLSPDLQLAFEGNREALGEALASRAQGRTLDPGDVYFEGGRPVYAAPRVEQMDDRFGVVDPLNPGQVTFTERRGPTRKEEIDRFNAENPVLPANSTWVGPDGQVRAQGYIAPEIANVAPGGEALVFDQQGNVTNRVASTQQRPMSDADQAAIARADNQITSLDTSINRANAIAAQIQNGELNLGPLTNIGSTFRNAAGMSDQNSLNYDALLSWAKEARNAILQANTGVQTDQDAIRELDTILSGTRDERIVSAALRRFVEARTATKGALQRDIDRRSGGSQPQGGVVSVSSPQEAAALPPGTRYRAPNGRVYIRE